MVTHDWIMGPESWVFSYAVNYIAFSHWGHLIINLTMPSVDRLSFTCISSSPTLHQGPTGRDALSPTEGWRDLLDFETYYMPACLKALHQRNVIYSRGEQYIRAWSNISHMCTLSSWVIQRDKLTTCGVSYHFQQYSWAELHSSSEAWSGREILQDYWEQSLHRYTTELWELGQDGDMII